jgi:hypothetical protein
MDVSDLPIDAIALFIMSMLGIKDFVALDNAGALRTNPALREAQTRMQPILMPRCKVFVTRWLLTKGYHVKGCTFSDDNSRESSELRTLIVRYSGQLHDISLEVSVQHSQVTTGVLDRCSRICINEPLKLGQIRDLCLHTSNLYELSIKGAAAAIQTDLLRLVVPAAPRLSALSIDCDGLQFGTCAILESMGNRLTALSLLNYSGRISEELYHAIATVCPNLKSFVVGHSGRQRSDVDAVILAIGQHCQRLEELSFVGCKISRSTLRVLLNSCCKLRTVRHYNGEWSAEELLVIAECGARLESISIQHALLGDVETYSTLFAHLRYVWLLPDFVLSPAALSAVLLMRSLLRVSLSCGGVTDVSSVLLSVADTCVQLQELRCHNLQPVNNTFSTALRAVLTKCKSLHHLRLNVQWPALGVAMPRRLAEALANCHTLRSCTLGCYKLTDEQILLLAPSLPGLVSLEVAVSTALTDASILSIAQYCRKLWWLNVSGSTHITVEVLERLTQRCRRLCYLYVHRHCMSAATAATLCAEDRLESLHIKLQ